MCRGATARRSHGNGEDASAESLMYAGWRAVAEVLGPAGAGKTTVVARLRERGIPVCDQIPLSLGEKLHAFRGITRRFAPAYLRMRPHGRPFSLEELRRLVYVDAWSDALPRCRRQETITVLDHGPVFMLGMLQEFGPDLVRSEPFGSWSADAIRRWGTALDVVVWLDASDLTLVERVERRHHQHGIKGKPWREACAFLHRCRSSFERILEQLTGAHPVEILRFNTDRTTIDAVVDRLLEEVADVGSADAQPAAPPERSAGLLRAWK